jgi:hypothetical protein
VSRRVELLAAALGVDEATGVRAALSMGPVPASAPPFHVDTEEGDELDGLLLEIMEDETHPRQVDAAAAYQLRHGWARGYVPGNGVAVPPRSIREWDRWTIEHGVADAADVAEA